MAIVKDLVIEQFGAYLSKHQGRLRVTVKGERVAEAPLMHLERVVVGSRGVSVSSDAIAACCHEGIPIHFVDAERGPYAALYAPGLTGTVLTRREQLAAYNDARGVALARALADSKIANQAMLLRYLAKYRQEADPARYHALQQAAERMAAARDELAGLQAQSVDALRERLLAAEGRAAHHYWSALLPLVPAEYGWPGREGRGATDALNSALNYGYGILYGTVERAIVLAGLDPYAGFIHADRPGKPSLVLDLIEPFRPPAVDRVVLALATRRMPVTLDERGRLDEPTRRLLAEQVLGRLAKPERYEGKRVLLGAVIQHEARHLATYCRGERETYRPFQAHW